MKPKAIHIITRILSYPFVLAIMIVSYNIHAVRNSILFLQYGGEWITYHKGQRHTIEDIYKTLTDKP